MTKKEKVRLGAAFAIAAVSDFLSIYAEAVPPLQWLLDIVTALLLFAALGWNWLLLPGLVAEAIPGLAAVPAWLLVVASITAVRAKQGTPAALPPVIGKENGG